MSSSARRRHVATHFAVVTGPADARCDHPKCGVPLAGARCWTWVEDGERRYGCCNCCFKHARVRGVGEA